ncbi:hypothetical protein DH86_00004083, partial [Scytalidium sp. 3C]
PYAYFTEKDFSQRLEDEQLPSYLLMVIIATAARFSQDPYFEGRQQEVAERFCHKAWNEICERLFSGDDVLQITIVQATNMLAVVDFTSGRQTLAWVKIGLAIRFAQSLRLADASPTDLTSKLNVEQKHERIMTFWSVYLLDRLVSCAPNRPPTISDNDCT